MNDEPQGEHNQERSERSKLLILAIYASSLVLLGFGVASPSEILLGLGRIVTAPDTLITDYLGVGGLGATLVNSGSITLIIIFIFHQLKIPINGFSVACLFTVAGFAFFGKNLFNVWFIVSGVFLYAKSQRKSFAEFIYPAFFGTALSPVVTEILFSTTSEEWLRVPLGISISLAIGFILPSVAAHLLKVHQGFNLYNMGFTAGIVGTIVVALLNSYGIVPVPQMIWTSGHNSILGGYLLLMFSSMILTGINLEKKPRAKIRQIWSYSGQLVTDFVLLTGFGSSLINMGIDGFIVTLYVLLIGGDLNGPTMAGIFTVVGFSAVGKHPKNILPIVIGIYLGTLGKQWDANDPSMQLAALFGTTLAPIAGQYGWFWGIVAGFIHSSAVHSVGVLHGGLNLYNNGFAAGIVAAVLLPIIKIFKPLKPFGEDSNLQVNEKKENA
jgi:hypothetical protein